MGRHRAPDPDEPTDGEPSDDYSEPQNFGDAGGQREPDGFPPAAPPEPGGFPGPSYTDHPADDYSDEFHSDSGYFDYTNPSDHDEHHEHEPHPADVDTPDDFPDFPRRGPEPPAPPPSPPTGGHRGLGDWRGGHRSDGGRRGVSIGVIAALVTVVVLVAGVILWRFFGDALSNRSHSAAACSGSKETVAVIADPSIADRVQQFAERYNGFAAPVGDHCVAVSVKSAGSDAVVDGFIGNWPADLGQRPALWIPGSSVSAARLTAAAGKETITDSRSLVTSPVVLAVRPELQRELGAQKWATLPGLQTKPDALAGLKLPKWGSLRLALPLGGNSDAAYLAGEAVAADSAPPGAPPTDGSGAVRTLIAGQPKLADNTLAEAMNVLLRPGDPASAPVHAVVTTEQQLFARGESLPNAGSTLSSWLPPGPAAVADYPTLQLRGSWLSQDQVTAASGFAQFLHKPDQLAELAKAGFRVEGVKPPSSDVTSFAALPSTLSVGDDSLRATLANTVTTPSSGPAAIIMLEQSMTTDEGGKTRLANVVAALDNRIKALPPNSVIGLWTFDGKEGRSEVKAGPLGDDVDGKPRSDALTAALDKQHASSGGAVSFTTLRLIYKDALANYHPGQTNSVLVITAGPHTDQSLGGQGLQDFIKDSVDPAKPVAVNVIDFGSDSDRETWEAVAKLSGGSYQNLATSASPDLATAVTNFLS
ncbi:MAG TPA: substrate-binding domain-containing protein [Mycobacterium sp.]|uniref:substrate-binding domain-containing protein n=1 Tax=Mycobacterium sp. TaxID=1785 RepID=UPI002C381A91|nr:substrate-binding domain-containing protein [Mycobacterium sp.]HME77861.1 substrate-binding domain-containing protein [Mycobacterium sp.]